MHESLDWRDLNGCQIYCKLCNSRMKLRSTNSLDYYCSFCEEKPEEERIPYRQISKIEERDISGLVCLSLYFNNDQAPSYQIFGGILYRGEGDEPFQACEIGEAMEVRKALALFYKSNSRVN